MVHPRRRVRPFCSLQSQASAQRACGAFCVRCWLLGGSRAGAEPVVVVAGPGAHAPRRDHHPHGAAVLQGARVCVLCGMQGLTVAVCRSASLRCCRLRCGSTSSSSCGGATLGCWPWSTTECVCSLSLFVSFCGSAWLWVLRPAPPLPPSKALMYNVSSLTSAAPVGACGGLWGRTNQEQPAARHGGRWSTRRGRGG